MAIMFSSIRTWKSMTWPLAIAFTCVMAAVLAVIIGASRLERPAAAPQEGPYDFGFNAISYPTFAAGIGAASAIFVSSSGCPGTIPVIAKMKRPQDFTKVTVITTCVCTALYLCLCMTMYSYTGKWVASPTLGSAGPLVKKMAYGFALPSLIVSAGQKSPRHSQVHLHSRLPQERASTMQQCDSLELLDRPQHRCGCYCFHLRRSCASLQLSARPTRKSLFAPMSIMMPVLFWMADNKHYRTGTSKQKWSYFAHVLILLFGISMCVGGL